MYRNAYQRGMLTILFSGGAKPLNIWDVKTQDGYISRFLDQDIKSMVLEIGGTNVSTTYITCPKGKVVLGITMPFLVMIVKNLKKYFSFEVTVLDETLTRRRFRVSNFQSTTQILPLCTVMPIALSDGWNQIQFNLAEFCRRAYKKQYVEVQKLKINANIRLRRIYFAERLLPEDELPPEYKLYFPLSSKGKKDQKTLIQEIANKENIEPSTSQPDAKPMEEKMKSETKIVKPSSKASLHEAKISRPSSKASFHEVKISKPSSKASVYTIKKIDSHTSRKHSTVNAETITEGAVQEAVIREGSEKNDTTPVTEENVEPNAEESHAAEGGTESEMPNETVEPAVKTEDQPAVTTEAQSAVTTEVQPAEA